MHATTVLCTQDIIQNKTNSGQWRDIYSYLVTGHVWLQDVLRNFECPSKKSKRMWMQMWICECFFN